MLRELMQMQGHDKGTEICTLNNSSAPTCPLSHCKNVGGYRYNLEFDDHLRHAVLEINFDGLLRRIGPEVFSLSLCCLFKSYAIKRRSEYDDNAAGVSVRGPRWLLASADVPTAFQA